MEPLRRPDFDTLDHRALEEGIRLHLTLSIDTVVAIGEPVEELYRFFAWDKLDNFDDIILREAISRILFAIGGHELQLTTLCSQLVFFFF